MNKLLIVPKNKDIDCFISKGIDKFVFGLKDYCINYEGISIDSILEINSKYNIEIFLAINKNLNNSDLEYIKNILIRLNNTNIKVMFYDLAILEIVNSLKLNIDLIWNQTHMITNYNTCNYYYNEKVKYAYLSNEITLDEMIEIKNNSKIIPLVFVFGKSIMAFSKRKLLSNYFSSINKSMNKDNYLIKEKVSNNSYLIKENNLGTSIINNKLLNAIKPMTILSKEGFNNFVLSEDVNRNLFLKVIDYYNYALNKEVDDNFFNSLYDFIGSDNLGFFYNKTIFKVKKDEK